MKDERFHTAAQDLLKQQEILTKQLLGLLKQEYKTLSTSEALTLEDTTHEKQPVILSLDKLNQQWLNLLATQCTDLSPKGITLFLEAYDEGTTALTASWKDLQALASECKKANTVNGSIIALRFQAAQKTMAILRGQVPGNNVYDPRGNNTTGYSGGNALAKA